MAHEDPPPSPAVAVSPDRGTRWVVVVVAAAVGLAASFLAPAPWPEGEGRVRLDWRGERVAEVPATVGSTAPVALSATAGPHRIEVALPGGVPTKQPLRATLRVREGERTVRGLGDARLTVLLPDGREELVPGTGFDEYSGVLRAVRRPPRHAGVLLGLLGLVVVLWLTEAVPLFVTSLLVPILLVAAGAAEARAALAPFFDPVIAIFFGGFLMAEAMHRVGLDHRIAMTLVATAGRSPATLFLALLSVTAFLSLWMSNTAAAALVVPIALAVTEPIGHLGYRKATVLGIAYAATLGGVGSAVGTPANPLAIKFLESFVGRTIGFAEWFAFGLPMVVLFLPLMAAYLWRRSRVRIDPEAFRASRRVAVEERRRLGRITRPEGTVLAVFAAVVGLWVTEGWHGIDTGIVALAGAAALAVLGRLGTEDLGRISWASLLTFGGGLALGVHVLESGTSDWLASRLAGLGGLPSWLGVTVVASVALALTALASNTAAAAMMIPLSIPLAGVLGVDPVHLVVVVAIVSSIDFALVIGTPPTLIAYSTRLFRAAEVFRAGAVLDLLGVVLLLTVVTWVWRLLGVVP